MKKINQLLWIATHLRARLRCGTLPLQWLAMTIGMALVSIPTLHAEYHYVTSKHHLTYPKLTFTYDWKSSALDTIGSFISRGNDYDQYKSEDKNKYHLLWNTTAFFGPFKSSSLITKSRSKQAFDFS